MRNAFHYHCAKDEEINAEYIADIPKGSRREWALIHCIHGTETKKDFNPPSQHNVIRDLKSEMKHHEVLFAQLETLEREINELESKKQQIDQENAARNTKVETNTDHDRLRELLRRNQD